MSVGPQLHEPHKGPQALTLLLKPALQLTKTQMPNGCLCNLCMLWRAQSFISYMKCLLGCLQHCFTSCRMYLLHRLETQPPFFPGGQVTVVC